jgi:hypothetical protein
MSRRDDRRREESLARNPARLKIDPETAESCGLLEEKAQIKVSLSSRSLVATSIGTHTVTKKTTTGFAVYGNDQGELGIVGEVRHPSGAA